MNKLFVKHLISKGITLPELAKELKVSHQSVYLWKNGKSRPTLKHMKRLAELLDLTPDEIFKIFYE